MELLCGTPLWNPSVEFLHGTPLWNSSVELLYGTPLWNSSVEVYHNRNTANLVYISAAFETAVVRQVRLLMNFHSNISKFSPQSSNGEVTHAILSPHGTHLSVHDYIHRWPTQCWQVGTLQQRPQWRSPLAFSDQRVRSRCCHGSAGEWVEPSHCHLKGRCASLLRVGLWVGLWVVLRVHVRLTGC